MGSSSPDDFDATIVSLGANALLSGRYRLVRELGRGGMGVVWLASDQTLDRREVAIKLLPTGLSRDKRSIGRLKREAHAALDLTHPHIVRLINFEQDPARGGLAYLVMQYVEGGTLDDRLADQPDGLPLEAVLPWAQQIAQGLDYAHKQGVLHRDLKPSNILIDASGSACLTDFGMAREARDSVSRLTGRESSGTLPYMSPQQVLGRDFPSNDIYSLAATLYEALSGTPPFVTGDLVEQIRQVTPPPMVGQPEHVNAALLAGLAKCPEDRPGSAAALVARLSGVLSVGAVRLPEGLDTVDRRTGDQGWSKRIREPRSGIEFVLIASGTFNMGSDFGRSHLRPAHTVTIEHPFYLARTPVTQQQWAEVMGLNPSRFKRPDHPVECVNWKDCQDLLHKLKAPADWRFSLPSEAQWEYACRAGTAGRYSFGDDDLDLDKYAWYAENSGNETHPVARKTENPWGLFDMHGNVWEWCEDTWHPRYESDAPRDGSGWVTKGARKRVIRGGCWYYPARYCPSAFRGARSASRRLSLLGFRPALVRIASPTTARPARAGETL